MGLFTDCWIDESVSQNSTKPSCRFCGEILFQSLVDTVLANFPEKVAEYKAGKVGLLGLFVGEVMKASKGKAEPKQTNEIIRKKLGS